MTITQAKQFQSFEEYLATDPAQLPEGRFEYWDGELIPAMSESGFNALIANWLFFALVNAGLPIALVRPHSCEVEVPGQPRTRFPDLTVLDDLHLPLIEKRERVTRDMPPPRLLVEVVSPGDENSDNYKRDYQEKCQQYAGIGVPEYWLIDPDRQIILIGKLITGAYQFQTFRNQETLISTTFPSLTLTATQILTAGQS